MTEVFTNILAAAGESNDRAREWRREWARHRPARAELDALTDLWRRGLVEPAQRLFNYCPRDAFPRSPADGSPGLLPEELCLAFPDPDEPGAFMFARRFSGLAFARRGLDRMEAWDAGAAAARGANAEFVLSNLPLAKSQIFELRGLRFLGHPDGFGAWAWSRWGGDGVACGAIGVSKAEVLDKAEATAACEGQIAILNMTPVSRAEWEALYAC